MLIQSLRVHFSARTLEWYGAGAMGTWGYYIITHPQLFTAPATKELFSGLARVAEFFGQPPLAIGALALFTAIVRAAALFINGAYQRTPLVRLLTALASAYIWTTIVIGYVIVNTANTGIVIYTWHVIADIVSCYRAGYDLVIAENTARQARALNGQRNGSERGLRSRIRRIIFSTAV